jgi:hypothetical protein
VVQSVVFLAILVLCVKPLGLYVAHVLEGKPAGLNRWLNSFERRIYRLCRIDPGQEMQWKTYAFAMLAFNAGLAVFMRCKAPASLAAESGICHSGPHSGPRLSVLPRTRTGRATPARRR